MLDGCGRGFVAGLFLVACGRSPAAPTLAAKTKPPTTQATATPAAYQTRWGGLFVRQGDDIVDAPPEDEAVARAYPTWLAKGPTINGMALTLMTAKTAYALGEEVRVIHVLDVSEPGRDVYIMGPKVPPDEFVDGKRATPVPEVRDYPWVAIYDGRTLPSPAIDDNYDITSYRFTTPGVHTIEWKPSGLQSNVITLQVR
jgi:hypothetical protein